MTLSHLRHTLLTAALLGIGCFSSAAQARGSEICYNCPPEWADWGSQLRFIEQELDIRVPQDNKNSGQSLAQLVAERNNPVADVVYYGVSFGIQAMEEDVIEPYQPSHWDEIPDELKDPDGHWFTIHSGTMGLMVNVDALDGAPVPTSWSDLLKPEYRGMVGYLDPASAFVGYVGAVAINLAQGGDMNDFTPAIDYFNELAANQPIVPQQTSYARVLSGEIPILLDYDFNAYRARHGDGANIEFVIPEEGSVVVPYVMSLVKNGPNPDNGRAVLDFVLSDQGQAVWANAYLRPVRESAISEAAREVFLPDSDYARAKTVDYDAMAEAQRGFAERYQAEVR